MFVVKGFLSLKFIPTGINKCNVALAGSPLHYKQLILYLINHKMLPLKNRTGGCYITFKSLYVSNRSTLHPDYLPLHAQHTHPASWALIQTVLRPIGGQREVVDDEGKRPTRLPMSWSRMSWFTMNWYIPKALNASSW